MRGDYLKVYLDFIFITNFLFDFIILTATSIILKRNVKLYKIIFGSLFGSLTILILFIRMSSIELFIFKVIISIFMILITFSYKNIRYTLKNVYYLYLISIILGGFLYFINIQISTTNLGLLFTVNDISLNIVISIILSIIMIYSYIKNTRQLKINHNKYYKINIEFLDGSKKLLNGFLDTGNKLIDPYKRRPIILVNDDIIDQNIKDKILLVPYYTASGEGLLKCINISKMYIDGILCKKKFLLGLTDNIKIDGVDCILNEKILEG